MKDDYNMLAALVTVQYKHSYTELHKSNEPSKQVCRKKSLAWEPTMDRQYMCRQRWRCKG